MSHAYPALFIGGPADGKRLFVDGRVPYHDVYMQDPGSFLRYHDELVMHRPLRVTYQVVDRIEGTRIFAPVGEKLCPGEVRQRLIAGYQAEGRH